MSTATDLYSSFRDYLKVTYRATPQGSDNVINVNERFTLRVTVENVAPDDGPFANPRIHFRNLTTAVQATEFATPIDAQNNPVAVTNLPFGEQALTPGERSSVTVNMRALKNIGDAGALEAVLDVAAVERVADVQVRAVIDQDQFFRIRKSVKAEAEIEQT